MSTEQTISSPKELCCATKQKCDEYHRTQKPNDPPCDKEHVDGICVSRIRGEPCKWGDKCNLKHATPTDEPNVWIWEKIVFKYTFSPKPEHPKAAKPFVPKSRAPQAAPSQPKQVVSPPVLVVEVERKTEPVKSSEFFCEAALEALYTEFGKLVGPGKSRNIESARMALASVQIALETLTSYESDMLTRLKLLEQK